MNSYRSLETPPVCPDPDAARPSVPGLPVALTEPLSETAGPFERLAKGAPEDIREELHGNMSAYMRDDFVETFMREKFRLSVSNAAMDAVNVKIDEFRQKTNLLNGGAKVPFRFGSFKNEEPEAFLHLLGELIKQERLGKLLVIGNGGAGVAGFLMYLANHESLKDITIVWNGGNSDVNFKAAAYLHGAITYEPHIEMKEGLQGLNGPLPCFINKLAMFIPVGDPLRLQPTFQRLEQNGQLSNTASGTIHEQIMIAMWQCVDDAKLLELGIPASLWYASRYNHSAIGEHDNAMWTLGTAARANKFSSDPIYSDTATGKTDSLMDRWTSTCVARLPSWYPPSILEDAIKNSLYHLNDTAFLIANSHRIESVLQRSDGSPVLLDNPAHLWWTNRFKDSMDAKQKVEDVIRDRVFIDRWDAWVRTGSNQVPVGAAVLDLPAFEYPDPARQYAQEYMKMVYEVQQRSKVFNIVEWVHLNYSDAVYASIVANDDQGEVVYSVANTTHRQQAAFYLESLLYQKRMDYELILQSITSNIVLSEQARVFNRRAKRRL